MDAGDDVLQSFLIACPTESQKAEALSDRSPHLARE
jgi:hypothetical protein